MPSTMCTLVRPRQADQFSAPPDAEGEYPLRQSASISITPPSEWENEYGSVIRPSVSWHPQMIRMARSGYDGWSGGCAVEHARWISRVRPMKQMNPAIPPAIMASKLFLRRSDEGFIHPVRRQQAHRVAEEQKRMPMWNRLLPQRSVPVRSICDESLFQVY